MEVEAGFVVTPKGTGSVVGVDVVLWMLTSGEVLLRGGTVRIVSMVSLSIVEEKSNRRRTESI